MVVGERFGDVEFIQQQLPNNTIKTVDLSTMAAGTYFITIYDNSFNKVAQAPFVVNK